MLLWSAVARADDATPPVRPVRFGDKAGQLVVSTAYPEIFASEAVEQLSFGNAQTVVLRIWAFAADATVPVCYATTTSRALYAPWEEEYFVRLGDANGERN